MGWMSQVNSGAVSFARACFPADCNESIQRHELITCTGIVDRQISTTSDAMDQLSRVSWKSCMQMGDMSLMT